jgi:hypothetical protein
VSDRIEPVGGPRRESAPVARVLLSRVEREQHRREREEQRRRRRAQPPAADRPHLDGDEPPRLDLRA